MTPAAVATVLADFHNWLTGLAAGAQREEIPSARPPEPDLHTLLGQMIAIRQEVNLQTKAVRSQQELSADSLRHLSSVVETLRAAQAVKIDESQAFSEENLRPLLKTLVDLHDAMSLANREIGRLRDSALPALGSLFQTTTTEPEPELPSLEPGNPTWWQRLVGEAPTLEDRWAGAIERWQAWHKQRVADEADRLRQQDEGLTQIRRALESVIAGYGMGLQRIERALDQNGLEAIEASGRLFDPEEMEAIEAIGETGQATGEVIDEVRRGYRWNGRVFRCAQVRVAR